MYTCVYIYIYMYTHIILQATTGTGPRMLELIYIGSRPKVGLGGQLEGYYMSDV